MPPLGSLLSTVPPAAWLAVPLLVAAFAALGGFCGIRWIRRCERQAIDTARRSVAGLTTLTQQRMASATEAVQWFDAMPPNAISEEQFRRLERAQTTLNESMARLAERRNALLNGEAAARKTREPFVVKWVRDPADAAGYPTREAFGASLNELVAAGRRSVASSGLMLIKMDRTDALQQRFGSAGVECLARKLGGVLCRAIRDEDLVCRLDIDTFGVLVANVDDEQGQRMAEAIRNSVRHYHFRIDECGDEVLVTASFGFTLCRPDESADLVLNRAGDALSRSQRRGRNQLHCHDGRQLALSAAS